MISMTETKLIPRQSPHTPPMLEMKSNQVILADRSNSKQHKEIFSETLEGAVHNTMQLDSMPAISPKLLN